LQTGVRWVYVAKIFVGRVFRLSLIICLLGFLFYVYKLHSLAVEGNRIFALRCTQVNPHLITYKKAFLTMADCIQVKRECTDEVLTIPETAGSIDWGEE